MRIEMVYFAAKVLLLCFFSAQNSVSGCVAITESKQTIIKYNHNNIIVL